MSKIIWDAIGEHKYETGVDHGVLYPLNTQNNQYDNGVAWNGLTSVSESPSGAESNPQYADNIKYLDLLSAEEFAATVECFTYPKEWEECDGSVAPIEGVNIYQQSRKTFGLSYRTKIGNDVNPDLGYKLHLVYGAKATPQKELTTPLTIHLKLLASAIRSQQHLLKFPDTRTHRSLQSIAQGSQQMRLRLALQLLRISFTERTQLPLFQQFMKKIQQRLSMLPRHTTRRLAMFTLYLISLKKHLTNHLILRKLTMKRLVMFIP